MVGHFSPLFRMFWPVGPVLCMLTFTVSLEVYIKNRSAFVRIQARSCHKCAMYQGSSWSIVVDQHITDGSNLLASDKHNNNTCFLVLPTSFFSLSRPRPFITWGKIHSIVNSFPREEAWLHKNFYYNSIKDTVMLLKIFLYVQLFIPAALRL